MPSTSNPKNLAFNEGAYASFSKVYDTLMIDIPYQSWVNRALELYVSIAGTQPGDVLDVACGTGTATMFLAKSASRVVGVDISEEMLAIASSKLTAVSSAKRPLLIKSDMLALPFDSRFDLVTCFCDSLNHVDDEFMLTQAFSSIRKSLKANGVFIFDFNTPYKISEVLGDNTYFSDFEGGCWVMDNVYDDETRQVEIRLSFFLDAGKGLYKRYDEIHVESWFDEDQISKALSKCNLKLLSRWDDYSESMPATGSERITYVALAV